MHTHRSRELRIDLVGQKFGRLTVLEVYRRKASGRNEQAVRCVCDCGVAKHVALNNLLRSNAVSCGCYSRELRVKHGHARKSGMTPEYRVWQAMKARCGNPQNKFYHCYGGRNIRVCDRWTSFDAFIQDMGLRPSRRHMLERKNNDGNYEPGNCCWATPHDQSRNHRRVRFFEWNGERLCLADWAQRFEVYYSSLWHHLKKGKPFDEFAAKHSAKVAARQQVGA